MREQAEDGGSREAVATGGMPFDTSSAPAFLRFMNEREIFIRIAQDYLTLRQRGDLSEARTIAHNALLDAMNVAGIEYEDREHAAQIAAEIVKRPEYYKELTSAHATRETNHNTVTHLPARNEHSANAMPNDTYSQGTP